MGINILTDTETPKSAQLHRGPGFRIRRKIERPDPCLVEGFREFPTPDISDLLNRLYTMKSEIKNLTSSTPICGPALAVKVYPGDNLMVHKALEMAEPGDIMVVDAGGSSMNGIVGDLIATKAHHRGIQGFVIDGLIRDLPELVEMGFPVFARGVTPVGPLHRGPGEINFPVSCGGIVVNPGDIICADENGVTVVRQDVADDLLDRLRKQRDSAAGYEEAVRRGEFDNTWVDAVLSDAGCVLVD